MNAYTCGGTQNHIVIANNMKKAAEIYEKVYGDEPEELKLFSEYVILQEDDSE